MRVHRLSAAKVNCRSGFRTPVESTGLPTPEMRFRRLTTSKILLGDHPGAIFRIALCLVFVLIFQPEARAAQAAIPGPPGRQEVVGRLSGDDVSVTGAIGFESENGRTTALLASGSDLTLRSGQAKVDLPDGGDIILCGPAHLSILKSGPAITIALDYG
jgi:hypothetical protein